MGCTPARVNGFISLREADEPPRTVAAVLPLDDFTAQRILDEVHRIAARKGVSETEAQDLAWQRYPKLAAGVRREPGYGAEAA